MADPVTCQAMLCRGSCVKRSHGNGMGNTGNMARLCDGKAIWYHQSPGTYHHMTMPLPRPSRLQNTAALMTPPPSHPAPNPPVNAPCIDAVFTAIDRSYVSGHWHYSCMTSTPQTMPLLMLYMSSNIDLHNIFCSHKRGA